MFEDGKSTSCDILVGADGIKSSVRRKFLQDLAQQAVDNGNTAEAEDLLAAVAPIWTGGVAYRTLIPVEQLHEIVIPQYPTQVSITSHLHSLMLMVHSIVHGERWCASNFSETY